MPLKTEKSVLILKSTITTTHLKCDALAPGYIAIVMLRARAQPQIKLGPSGCSCESWFKTKGDRGFAVGPLSFRNPCLKN